MIIHTFLTALTALMLLPTIGSSADEKELPSRSPEIVMPLIMKLDAEAPFGKITTILGDPDEDVGSGIHIYLYKLDDGTYLRVGNPGGSAIIYIDVLGKEQQLKKRIFPPGAKQPGT